MAGRIIRIHSLPEDRGDGTRAVADALKELASEKGWEFENADAGPAAKAGAWEVWLLGPAGAEKGPPEGLDGELWGIRVGVAADTVSKGWRDAVKSWFPEGGGALDPNHSRERLKGLLGGVFGGKGPSSGNESLGHPFFDDSPESTRDLLGGQYVAYALKGLLRGQWNRKEVRDGFKKRAIGINCLIVLGVLLSVGALVIMLRFPPFSLLLYLAFSVAALVMTSAWLHRPSHAGGSMVALGVFLAGLLLSLLVSVGVDLLGVMIGTLLSILFSLLLPQIICLVVSHLFSRSRRRNAKEPEEAGEPKDPPDAFVINLHGAWGSGKSSILNFLGSALREGAPSQDEAPQAVVMTYNAWKEQSGHPPWWGIPEEFYRQAINDSNLSWVNRIGLYLSRQWWLASRIRGQFWQALLMAFLIALAIYLGFDTVGTALGLNHDGKTLHAVFSLVAGLGTLVMLGLARTPVSTAGQSAEFKARTNDPMTEVRDHFANLVRWVNRPVLICVDDMDRCDFERVVEVMRSIHTLFHSAPTSCIVAAEEEWLTLSYKRHFRGEKRVSDEYLENLGEKFQEKLFQLKVRLPPLMDGSVVDYGRRLFAESKADNGSDGVRMRKDPYVLERIRERIREKGSREKGSREELERLKSLLLTEYPDCRSEIVQGVEEQYHLNWPEVIWGRVLGYLHLHEHNPRMVKRLINAHSFLKLLWELQDRGEPVPRNILIPWLILELRWPELAKLLVEKWQAAELLCEWCTTGVESPEGWEPASSSGYPPPHCASPAEAPAASGERHREGLGRKERKRLEHWVRSSDVCRVIRRESHWDGSFTGNTGPDGTPMTAEELREVMRALFSEFRGPSK